MKKTIISLSLLFAAFVLPSCNDAGGDIEAADVPAAVMTSFNSRFPNATDVEWEHEAEDDRIIYKAEFDFNGTDMKAEFDANGGLLESEGD